MGVGQTTELSKADFFPVPPPLRDADENQCRLATEEERAQILRWNETAFDFQKPAVLHQLIEEEFARHPDSAALVFEGQTLTCGELNARANQLAHYLRSRGVGRDAFVVVSMQRSFEMVIAMLAILKAGGAYVPVDPTFPRDLVEYMFGDAGAAIVLTQDRFAENLPAGKAQVVALPRDNPQWADLPSANPERINAPTDAAYCIYTSGSTGRPKGATNTHEAICNRLLWNQQALPMGCQDRQIQKTPFTFDVSVWEIFCPLICGATLVIARPEGHRDPIYLLELIIQHQATVVHFAPAMLNAFLDFAGAAHCTSIRRVHCSGETLPAEVQRRFFQTFKTAELVNLYGPTEAAVEVTWWVCQRADNRSFVPIGRPVANTEILILDPAMNLAGVSEPGELHIGGIHLARGYHRRPELTAERFVRHPFRSGERLYKTGDLARYLEDGSIQYLGRLDHQVKIGGIRIELDEIAAVLLEQREVREAVVAAATDAAGQTRLIAFVALTGGYEVSPEFLRTAAAQKLPQYQIPSVVCIVPKLPLNANGKVDRKALPVAEALRQLASSSPMQAGDPAAASPSTLLELQIKVIWEEILSRPEIGLDENFFGIGGGSILAARLFATLEKRLGINAPLSLLLTAPTIRQLAAAFDNIGVQPRREPCVLIQPKGNKSPLFITHGIGGNVLNFYELAHRFAPDRPVYGVQSLGVSQEDNPPATMEEMAARYVLAVRKIQPVGPYYLAGWSYGGVVVFEMARQLLAAGQKVGLLAILDSAIDNIDLDLSHAERLRRGASWIQQKIARDWAAFDALTPLQKSDHVRTKMKQLDARLRSWFGRKVKERSTETVARRRDDLMKVGQSRGYYSLLSRHYFPKRAEVAITYIEAAGLVTYFVQPIERWQCLAGKGIRHIKIDADHGMMLFPPAVDSIVRQLREQID